MRKKGQLAELFDMWGSDKNTHNYAPFFEKHLPESVNRLMEIGVDKGGGIKAFRDYYNYEGEYHAYSYKYGDCGMPTKQDFIDWGFVTHEAYQHNVEYIRTLPKDFDVVVEDASHLADDQIVTFKEMFVNNINEGGWYICEDLHCYNDGESGKYFRRGVVRTKEDTLLGAFKKFVNEGNLVSQFFSKEESDLISSLVDEVHFYNDLILFVKKKA